jgi:glycosyltransferase involved in cell wall biosynthesis
MGAPFSIVIPAFRERPRLGNTLAALIEHLDGSEPELIVVDDGSDDGTAEIATAAFAEYPNGRVLRFRLNRGKGAAVRAGALAASGEAIVFMDADLASDLCGLQPLLAALDSADIAVGSRTVTGSRTIGKAPTRAVMALGFNLMARTVMHLPIRDTQCGFKAFRRDAADRIFRIARSNRFAFDVEILTIARALELTIVEVPVVWTFVEGTSVRVIDPFQMAVDLARIGVRCRPRAVRRASNAMNPIVARIPDFEEVSTPGAAAGFS